MYSTSDLFCHAFIHGCVMYVVISYNELSFSVKLRKAVILNCETEVHITFLNKNLWSSCVSTSTCYWPVWGIVSYILNEWPVNFHWQQKHRMNYLNHISQVWMNAIQASCHRKMKTFLAVLLKLQLFQYIIWTSGSKTFHCLRVMLCRGGWRKILTAQS